MRLEVIEDDEFETPLSPPWSTREGRMKKHRLYTVLALVGAVLLSCESSATRLEEPRRQEAEPPASSNRIFSFLCERYDRNDDGRIAPREYDRPDGDFRRLDRNDDGVLTADDFVKIGRRQRGLAPREARRLRAVHLLAWYFQDDDERDVLGLDELLAAFRAFDADGDDRLGRREFEAVAVERARYGRRPTVRMAGLLEVETTDPWERTIIAVDRNDDGFMTPVELRGFFAKNDAIGAWNFEASVARAPEGSLVGLPAPDFNLPTIGGKRTVRLSSFRGDRPVALVFGSYT